MPTFDLSVPLERQSLTDEGVFTGYGSVFGVRTYNGQSFLPGCFTSHLNATKAQGRMPALLWQHDDTQPIGVYSSMSEDDNGLLLEGQLALGTQRGREAYELLKMKALTGLSIGYEIVKSKWDDANKTRLIQEANVFEVSLVTIPGNDAARVTSVQSAAERIATPREFEHFLREAGYSRTAAKAITASGFKQANPNPRDADGESHTGLLASLRAANQALTTLR